VQAHGWRWGCSGDSVREWCAGCSAGVYLWRASRGVEVRIVRFRVRPARKDLRQTRTSA
jgi:hypothetical protein